MREQDDRSGKDVRVNVVSDEGAEKPRQDEPDIQQRRRTEPMAVQGNTDDDRWHGQARAEEAQPLPEKIREDVEANRSKLTNADEILEFLDMAEREPEPKKAKELALVWRLIEAQKESWENRDRWLRAAADLENAKKRALQDRSKLLKYRNEELLRDLLPVLDNLERAIGHSEESSDITAFVEGVKMIAGMFEEVIQRYGVSPLESVGKPFDPNLQDAISRAPDPKTEPNTVIQELEKGYMYQDRLLRPAKVVVSYEPEQ